MATRLFSISRVIDTTYKKEDYSSDITSVELIRKNLSDQITPENNTILTITKTPSSEGIQLSLNGQILVPGITGDYTLNNRTITFTRTDIEIGDSLLVSYLVTN